MEVSSKRPAATAGTVRHVAEVSGEGAVALPRKRTLHALLVTGFYWLLPLVGLVAVLVAGYGALSERKYARANGFTAPLVAGQSAGQSFVARYNGLSGVSVQLGTHGKLTRGGLTLHLKPAPGEPDVATVSVPAAALTQENPWHTFRFPPIASSQDHPFYAEIVAHDEAGGPAPALAWWQPNGEGDSYPPGASYVDGKPRKADLAFGLHYSPPLVDAWAQVARAFSTNVSPFTVALLGALLAVPLVALTRKRPSRAGTTGGGRWVLPPVLLIALAHSLIYALLIPPWQGPDEPSHFAYAALLDRHGMDSAFVQGLGRQGGDPDPLLNHSITASMNRHGFTRYLSGHPEPGEPVQPSTSIYSELRQPPAYYWLAASALRVARWAGLPADPYTNPEVALRVVRFVSVLLSLGVVALAWLAGWLLGCADGVRRTLPLLMPLTVALFPMRTFAASMANNDVLAELAVSGLVVAVIALLCWPQSRRALALAGLILTLAALASVTKASALAAVVPLLMFALIAWLGQLFAGRASTASPPGGVRVRRLVLTAVSGAVAGTLMLAVSPMLFKPSGTAVGWKLDRRPVEKAPIARNMSAINGYYVLALPEDRSAQQQVEVLRASSESELTLTGYARVTGGSTASPASAVARLEAPGSDVGRAEIFASGGAWTFFTNTVRVAPGVSTVAVKLFAKGGGAEFDGLALVSSGAPANVSLLNRSFDEQELTLRGELARLLPEEAAWIAQVWANPQPFDKAALWAYYAGEQYRSFWGNFGWVSAGLPEGWYIVWGAASTLALLGLLGRLFTSRKPWDRQDRLGLLFLLTLVAAVVLGLARHTMLLSVFGVEAFPQGRYLFVLSIPLAWLFISGLSAWGGLVSKVGLVESRHASPLQDETLLSWGVWAGANLIDLFAAFALLAVVVPYYYG